jgi:hypothetical protein
MEIFGLQLGDIVSLIGIGGFILKSNAVINKISNKIENIDDQLNKFDKQVDDIELTQKATELQLLINTKKDQYRHIQELYTEYTKRGGNSYINDLYKEWHDKYFIGK